MNHTDAANNLLERIPALTSTNFYSPPRYILLQGQQTHMNALD